MLFFVLGSKASVHLMKHIWYAISFSLDILGDIMPNKVTL